MAYVEPFPTKQQPKKSTRKLYPQPPGPLRKKVKVEKTRVRGVSTGRAIPNWSERTAAYVKAVTKGKGAPCKIWSINEKKQLLDALKKHPHQDWDNLCRCIPTRSKAEIQDYIHTLKGGVEYKSKGSREVQLEWAPIESWLDMSIEMVHYEQTDLSKILSRVFSIMGNFSQHPEPSSPTVQPDYGKLYRYIAAIMDESLCMPDLTPLESAIVADLMHGISDKLRLSDTSLQRKVMCWKYKMLNYKFDFDDIRSCFDRIRKALTNDFSDLQRDGNRIVSGLASAVNPTGDADQNVAGTSSDPVPVASTSRDDSVSPEKGGSSSKEDASKSDAEKASSPKRKRGRPAVYTWRRPLEKPRLYSMNPFCVPIRLLRLKRLATSATKRRSESVSTASTPRTSTREQARESREKIIEEAVNQAKERQDLRQVSGIYQPAAEKKKKRVRGTLPEGQFQVSSATMKAVRAALAIKKLTSAAATSGQAQPASVETQPMTVRLPSEGDSSSNAPVRTFRCVQLPDGRVVLAALDEPKTEAEWNPVSPASQAREQMPPPVQMPPSSQSVSSKSPTAVSPSKSNLSLSPTLFHSPLRAPVASCAVSVGTEEEEGEPDVIAPFERRTSRTYNRSKSSAPTPSNSQALQLRHSVPPKVPSASATSVSLAESSDSSLDQPASSQVSQKPTENSVMPSKQIGQSQPAEKGTEDLLILSQQPTNDEASQKIDATSSSGEIRKKRQRSNSQALAGEGTEVDTAATRDGAETAIDVNLNQDSSSEDLPQQSISQDLEASISGQSDFTDHEEGQQESVTPNEKQPPTAWQTAIQRQFPQQTAAPTQKASMSKVVPRKTALSKSRALKAAPVKRVSKKMPTKPSLKRTKPARPVPKKKATVEVPEETTERSEQPEVLPMILPTVRPRKIFRPNVKPVIQEILVKPPSSPNAVPEAVEVRIVQLEHSSQSSQSKLRDNRAHPRPSSADSAKTASKSPGVRPNSADQQRSCEGSSPPRKVMRSVSYEGSSSYSPRKRAVVTRPLSGGRSTHTTRADWSKTQESSPDKPASDDADSPVARFSGPVKTYTRVPKHELTGEKPPLIPAKGKVAATAANSSTKTAPGTSGTHKAPQPAIVIRKTLQTASVASTVPQLATPPSATTLMRTPQSVTVTPRTPQSATIMPRTPQSATIISRTPQSAKITPRTPQSATITPRTPQSATITPRTPQSVTISAQGVPKPPQTATVVSKTPQSATAGSKTPQSSDSVQTTQQSASVTSKSAGQLTPQSSTGQNKGAKSSFKAILAQVASPHCGTPKSAHKRPAAPEEEFSSSTSPTSSPSPPKKHKLSKNFLHKPKTTIPKAEAPVAKKALPRGWNARKEKKGREGRSVSLNDMDISGRCVEVVTPDMAKERLKLNELPKSYEAERKQRLDDAVKGGRNLVQMVLDNDEVSLISL
ncbi:uncharacterized protein [Littorina saxatilis]|uniref:Myb-like domain-containing protein n=1 Tax=Littorina saxatilis TaxID=31220 RepID=A0AAN9ANW2_9CAEN